MVVRHDTKLRKLQEAFYGYEVLFFLSRKKIQRNFLHFSLNLNGFVSRQRYNDGEVLELKALLAQERADRDEEIQVRIRVNLQNREKNRFDNWYTGACPENKFGECLAPQKKFRQITMKKCACSK